jgi:hypothetical protein
MNILKGILRFIVASIFGGIIAAVCLIVIAIILYMTGTDFTWKALGQVWIGASFGFGGLMQGWLEDNE